MSDPVFARPKKDPEFDPKRFLPRPLFESPEMKVVRATFRAGQFIPVHAPDVHVALYILSGEGEVVAGKERRNVTEGDLVVVPEEGPARRQGEDRHDRAARRLAVPDAGRPRQYGGTDRPRGVRAPRLTQASPLRAETDPGNMGNPLPAGPPSHEDSTWNFPSEEYS